jgi:hypothetical protein
VDAFIITSPQGERGWLAIPITLVLLLVAIPHVIAWDYGTRSITALQSTFVSAAPGNSETFRNISLLDDYKTNRVPFAPRIQRFTYRDKPRSAIFQPGLGDPEAVQAFSEIANSVVTPAPFVIPEDPLDKDRLTILLVGGDAGPGREGLRTDSMNIATIDLATGQRAAVSRRRGWPAHR